MHRHTVPAVLLCAVAAACHGYAPAPVDLHAHLRAFAARLPDPTAAPPDAAPPRPGAFDLRDGIDRREAATLAIWFHPDCRLARRRAGAAQVARDEAGRWHDPTLDVDAARILESVPHPWLLAAGIGLSLPLSGRLDGERALAAAELDAAVVAARIAEADAVHGADLAFARRAAAERRAAVLRELGERLGELEAIAQRLAAAGERTALEARAFTLERLARAAELAQAEHAAAAATLALKRCLGLHPEARVEFTTEAELPLQIDATDQRQERLLTGPRLAAAQHAHAVAERRLALAVAAQWPDLQLGPGWQEEDAEPRAALGISLPLPLFAGNTPAIRRAEADRETTAEALRTSLEQALHDLAAAELALCAAREQRDLVREGLLPTAWQQVADGRRLAELGELQPLLLLDALVRAHDAALQAIAADLAVAEATAAVNHLFWNPPAEDRR
ncbi:MAG: TolC family protein [Planctomycetes bacterium]|nr:TolC family protein [Planctomycetota bacterium]